MPRADWRWYRTVGADVVFEHTAFVSERAESIDFVRRLLSATAARPPRLRCFGLHEWAMVYRLPQEDVRHSGWPLRLGTDGTDAVVESHPIACSHFDAYRFFTPEALPRSTIQPTREDQVMLEQPGCLHAGMLRGIEPFPTTDLVPYDPGYLAGWTVERYQIDLIAAAERSRQQMDATLRSLCESQIPGDTHRNLVVNATYSNQTFKHILAPIWLLTYVYRGTSYQVAVNGVTGRIAGSRPYSWIKIALLVLAALVVAAIIAASQQ